MPPVRVLIADDHPLLRDGLTALLTRERFTVVGEASDGAEAVRLAEHLKPDVAVLDLTMPVMNGLEAAREMQATGSTRVAILSVHREDHYVLEALRAGVKAYVLKSQAAREIAEAIRQVSRGGVYLSPGLSEVLFQAYVQKKDPDQDPLSPRERQVLQLVAEGRTTKEIAHLLDVSIKTADSHRTRLMKKLDIHETAGLVRYAIRRGIVEP
ncbi:MAG TPA: response regulator transcription factor [Vicinamibacteria bacterium]|nr:response regulator transcription factor [Vicinamibacteria bacterium]